MSKSKPKYWELPWDCQRWNTSPTRATMTYAERGLYIEMLIYQWVEGSVPDDPGVVAALMGRTLEETLAVWGRVRAQFSKLKNGTLRNVRLEKIRRLKIGLHSVCIDNKRKAARARWSKQRGNNARALQTDANEVTIERKNEVTNKQTPPLPPRGNGVCDATDFEIEWARLKDAYPKDTLLHARLTEDAWVAAVLDAADPSTALREVWAGLERMKASGRERRYLPSLKDFLAGGRFRERWEPDGEQKQTSYDDVIKEMESRYGS